MYQMVLSTALGSRSHYFHLTNMEAETYSRSLIQKVVRIALQNRSLWATNYYLGWQMPISESEWEASWSLPQWCLVFHCFTPPGSILNMKQLPLISWGAESLPVCLPNHIWLTQSPLWLSTCLWKTDWQMLFLCRAGQFNWKGSMIPKDTIGRCFPIRKGVDLSTCSDTLQSKSARREVFYFF